jgi:hypothetical protein
MYQVWDKQTFDDEFVVSPLQSDLQIRAAGLWLIKGASMKGRKNNVTKDVVLLLCCSRR